MKSIEDMTELEWRKYVADQFVKYSSEHNATLTTIKKVEAQTRLARDVQDVSKAMRVLYRVAGCVSKVALKLIAAGVVVYILGYMALNSGVMPGWARDILSIIRGDR